MRKVTFAEWITELRNTTAKQTFTRLRNGDCYCATGILANMIDPDGWNYDHESWYWHHTIGSIYLGKIDINEYTDFSIGYIGMATRLNDITRASFAEIASKLEERYANDDLLQTPV